MKILHVNISDRSGGAAVAALRLHNAMLAAGIDSKYLVLNRVIKDRTDIVPVSKRVRNVKEWRNVALEDVFTSKMHGAAGSFSSFLFGIDITTHPVFVESDIVYLHWVSISLINHSVLKKILQSGKKVYWFMHDMFPITGGCHYAMECEKYKTKCSQCPYYQKNPIFPDLSVKQFERKRKLYAQFPNLSFITPSKWLCECAQSSALTKNNSVFHIPNLITEDVFKPLDRTAACDLFSIPQNKKYIGFGADGALGNPYKGWEYLRDALHILAKSGKIKSEETELLIFGSSENQEIANSLPFKAHFPGTLRDEYSLAMLYNAMSVFVIPSVAENFSNTILESLACGTQVVGFDTGGIPETVNDKTGYLAKYKNSEDLANGILSVLQEPKTNVWEYIMQFTAPYILEKHKELW